MIKNLRRRIIAISVITAGLILFFAIILLFSAGYARINKEREKRLNFALEYNPLEEDAPFQGNSFYYDIALVHCDVATGKVLHWYLGQSCDLSPEVLTEDLDAVLSNPANQGVLHARVLFSKKVDGNIVKIAFNDLAERSNSLVPYLVTALGSLILGLGVYLVVSIFVAQMALKPVEDSWKKQKQFVADASHELKTPLAVIMANTDILASHQDETVGSQMQWVANTQAEAKRMAGLVADLLFLAKNDDGMKVSVEEVDFSNCVGTVVLSYEALFYENKKEFTYEIAPNLHIDGNVGQLKQFVTILLDNANKYSKGSGNINLRLFSTGKHVRLTVQNDCEQLSEEQISHLFDRFYTVDQSRNKNNGGNGLGLSIAQTICQTHNGNLRVEYENERIAFTADFLLKRNK